eukprot:TRINITY_DN9960_c0_g1_i1.p1 TRINITY_DN9960_c0_g1~~TRINITY_DN9960_c0_g1_i1.p1  ORF type:complete len:231 (-),score=44.37 TRINITY_DN9960_c0_g1_i1:75-767(-)
MALPNYSSVKQIVINKHGEVLQGIFSRSVKETNNLVLLCHGTGQHKDNFFLPKLADSLASIGFNSFRFDFAGNGESQGQFSISNYMREVEDLRSVYEHFTALGNNVIAAVGHSKGAGVALLYAGKYDDIPYTISVSGRYDLVTGMKKLKEIVKKKGYALWPAYHNDGKQHLMHVTQSHIDEMELIDMNTIFNSKKSKICVIHGTADEIVPFEDSNVIYQKLSEVRPKTQQ